MPQVTSITEDQLREQAAKDGIAHLSTGVAVLKDGKVLVVRRAKGDFLGGQYELPGGGVDQGETVTASAVREVLEETGLTVKQVLGTFDGFDYTTDKKPKVRQFNFLVEAEPGEVRLDPAEHDAYLWVDAQTLGQAKMSDSMHRCVLAALQLSLQYS